MFIGCGTVDVVRLAAVIFCAVVALSEAVEEKGAPFAPLNIVTFLDVVLPVAVEPLLPAILLERRLIEPLKLVVAILEDTVMVEA